MDRKKINTRALWCLFALVPLTVILMGIETYNSGWAVDNTWYLWLYLIPLAGFFCFRLQDRCPHCQKWLYNLPLNTEFCPYCGQKF